MRKFTKEITALLAAATVSASAGAITASSEEIEATVGVMVAPTEEYPAVDGGMMPPDDYIEQPDTTAIAGTYTTTTTTTTTTIPPLMGTYTTSKATTTVTTTENLTTTTLVGTYTTCTTTTTIPPTAGVDMPSDDDIELTIGDMMPPDDYIEPPTEEELPPTAGVPMPPDSYIETTTTTTEEIPPIMGGFPLPDPDGDINLDGKFGIADVVTIQKWMLGKKDVEIKYWENADLYKDGKLDVYDVCLMREKLIKDNYIDKKNTFLEFQITENVENADFSQYNRIYGLMGGKEYYGKGYSAVKDEDGNEVKPEHYVIYTITAYPDYADGGQYITRIEITDPNVMVHGLTVKSSFEDFEAVFKAMGYETSVTEHGRYVQYNAKNKDGISYTIHISNEVTKLTIQAEVTNRDNIQY